jgi:cytochrome c oxidase assembly protein subunit 15
MKLFPFIVTLHLMGGMILLALLVAQSEQSDPRQELPSKPYGIWLTASFIAVWLQIFLGGWVSTNYAVLACNEFPTCLNGAWLPATSSDWNAGFTLWRPLGQASASGASEAIGFPALTAIHLTHRVFALLVVLAIAGLIMRLKRYPALRSLKLWLMAILTLQIITGISNVVFNWPLLAAVMHTGGAAGLVLVLTKLWTKIK